MRRYMVVMFVITLAVLLCGCTETYLTDPNKSPSPSPSGSPSPVAHDDCDIIQTEIIIRDSKGKRLSIQWRYLEDVNAEARFVFWGQLTPGFDASACPQLTSVTSWFLLPINLCATFGNVFSNAVVISCLRPGTLDITVTPAQLDNGVTPPQGRAIYSILP